ncbi:MAG: glycosyltransferase family 4 protein [Proteobacteria bacterium]|nr:glycosyltransferase family 4 protein [Pseudomonadota bacterium]
MIDIANAAVGGQDVALIAGRLVQRNNPLEAKIKFTKIIRYNRRTTFKRLFTWSVAFVQIWFLITFRYRLTRLLIVSNPPFAPLLPLFCSNRFSLLIFDVYPDALVEFGLFSNRSWLVRLWESANRRVFGKADRIFTITEGMKQVLQQYAGKKNIDVVPVWTDNTFLKPVPKDSNPFVKKHGLQNKFVVLYSGNLGYSHNVETIIELAACVDDPEILFLLIGDGDKKQIIENTIRSKGLTNCRLLPFQPAADLPFSLSSADVAVVTLGREASRLSVPSKTYNLMSVGVPLLCIAEQDSDLSKLVAKLNIGESFSADRLTEMKAFIIGLAADPQKRQQFRENALNASLEFGPENATKILTN